MKRKPSRASQTAPDATPAESRGARASSTADETRRRRKRIRAAQHAGAPDLVTAARGFDRLRLFVAAVQVAGLDPLLAQPGPFTVFAPTNRAFEKLSPEVYDALLADPARLAQVLCHHVVPGRVKAPRPETPGLALPIAGGELRLSATTERYHVESAGIVRTNIRASNGVIHAIDTVLLSA